MSITVRLTQKENWCHSGLNELEREKAILLRRLRDLESIKSDRFLEKLGGLDWERRRSRRQVERRQGDVIIPNGPWDNDLDEYHGNQEYPVELPSELHSKGYRAYACRNFYTWTWNGYVSVQSEHPFFTVATNDELFNNFSSKGITSPPQEITFIENGTFGWDHSRSHECCPVPRNSTEPSKIGYIDFDGISRECVEFATWLASHEHFKITKVSCDCGKCAGCLWDRSNVCSGEFDCTCVICRPYMKRFKLETGKTSCCCDPQSCNCYGCFKCVDKCAKISQEVNTMVDDNRTSSFLSQSTSVTSVALSNNTEDNDGHWITVCSKRRSKHK